MDELDATVTSWLGLPYPPTPVMHMRVPLMGTLGYLTGLALLLAWRRKAVIPSDGDPNGTVVWSPGAGTLVPVSVQPIFKMVQVVHNIGLSLFSLACFLGTLHACLTEEWVSPASVGGLYGGICVEDGSSDAVGDNLRRWFWWYQLSKYWEFIDTFFLVVTGKDVSLLHVYHHAVVTLTSWTWVRGDLR